MEEKRKNSFNKVVYLSIRESDGAFAGYKKSVSILGSGENGNISLNKIANMRYNHNSTKNFKMLDDFFIKQIKTLHEQDKTLRFAYYNKHRVTFLPKDIQSLIVNQPPKSVLRFWDDKFKSRRFVKNFLQILKYRALSGEDITYDKCKEIFKNAQRFVVQARHSVGGAETFLLTKNSEEKVLKCLNKRQKYEISEYKENNVAINVHFLIAQKSILVLPPSVQIIDVSNDTLDYRGCDYAIYEQILSKKVQTKVEKQTKILAEKMREQGYLGVAGVDFIVCGEDVFFMEVNPRFQSSTIALNMALFEHGLKSVNELDNLCFTKQTLPTLPKICVNYSKISLAKGEQNNIKEKPYKIILDGFDENETIESGAYLYTIIYKGSIYKDLLKK